MEIEPSSQRTHTDNPRSDGQGLAIRLLGELTIVRVGRVLALPASKRTRALLGFLAVTRREQRRDRLCDLLWERPDDPRGALRWSLSKVRPLVDDGLRRRLVADRERVALELADVDVDLVNAQALMIGGAARASTADLRKVAARFRGELLEGLDLPGCHSYHRWLIAERAQARGLRISVLEALMDRVEVDAEEAVTVGRALVAVDPLEQSSHVRLVRLLGGLGRTAEARLHYDSCARMLRELEVAPSPDLVAAHVALGSAGSPKPPTPAAPSPPRPAATQAVMVGRYAEMVVIEEALTQARVGGAVGLVLVAGEPGLGKTRLLEYAADRHRATGGAVLAGRAFQAEMVRPYGPWIDALRSLGPEGLPKEAHLALAPLLPELAGAAATAGRPPDQAHLFDGVGQALRALAGAHGSVLVLLDDLHWFDEASAALLHYLARSPWSSRVLLATGVRPGELADNAPALRMLRALDREGRLTRIELAPLDPDEVSALARAVSPKEIDLDRVIAESGGNPLFAMEVATALARGQGTLSETLAQLIEERLSGVGVTARDVLPWAAALGRTFNPELLGQVSRMAGAQLTRALEELERLVILRASRNGGGEYDFSHDLVREAAYRRLSTPRRQFVHRQIASTLDALADQEGALAGEVALHAALGGDEHLAARSCLQAGERCLRLYAHHEAAALADRGRAHASTLAPAVRLPLEARLLRLYIHPGLSPTRIRELRTILTRLIGELQDANLGSEVPVCFRLLIQIEYFEGDYAAVQADSLRAQEVSRSVEPTLRARTLARAGNCFAWLEQDMPRAFALLTEAERIARQEGIEIADLTAGLGLLRFHAGEDDEAMALLEHGAILATREADPWIAFTCALQQVIIDLECARPTSALRRCQDLGRLASAFAQGSEAPAVAALAAVAAVAAGEAAGRPRLDEALSRLRAHDNKRMSAFVFTAVARIDLAAGETVSARLRGEEALHAAEVLGRRSELLMAHVVLARIAIDEGDRGVASRHLAVISEDLARPGGAAARIRAAAAETAHTLVKVVRGGLA